MHRLRSEYTLLTKRFNNLVQSPLPSFLHMREEKAEERKGEPDYNTIQPHTLDTSITA